MGGEMADVQIQQTPATGSGAGWVWGLVVLILLAVIGWFVFGGGLHRTTTTKIDINTPGASAPAPSNPAPPSGGGNPRP
jgi:Na+/proline symporter